MHSTSKVRTYLGGAGFGLRMELGLDWGLVGMVWIRVQGWGNVLFL